MARTPAGDSAQQRRLTVEIIDILRSFTTVPAKLDADASFMETLVATILSQNTSDTNSARAYRNLRAAYRTWADVAVANRAELAATIRSGGLADQKAGTILNVLARVHERYGSYDPPRLDGVSDDELLAELTSLKGVGLKTAACVLMFSLGRDICAVDTHVHRFVNRVGIVHASTPDRTFAELRPLIPAGMARQFHVDMILFGRYVCKAQRPHCFECPVYDHCGWELKEEYAEAARPGPAPVSGDLLLVDMFPERGQRAAAAVEADREARREAHAGKGSARMPRTAGGTIPAPETSKVVAARRPRSTKGGAAPTSGHTVPATPSVSPKRPRKR